MDFSAIFQLRTKKFWWMDVIFYFVIALLIATVLCWLIFLTKDGMLRKQINDEISALKTVGTEQQKEHEKNVIDYRDKINDFTNLFKNHGFASNVFSFMQAQTMPNVWFKQFSLDAGDSAVRLSGESDNLDALSRQVAAFEKNKYVKNMGTLNSSLRETARIDFSTNLALNQNIFSYLSGLPSISETTTPSEQPLVQGEQLSPQSPGAVLSSEKMITSFHLLLSPEVVGVLDETNHTVVLNVPYGTDVKNLTSLIAVSSGATISPASNVLQDFTNPVIYKVTAQDGSVRNYELTVIVAVAPLETEAPPAKEPNQPESDFLIIAISAGIIVAVIAIIFLFIWKRSKKQKIDTSKISNI